MAENFRPHPENPKQHAPEAGAGPLGLPPPDPEQQPQGEGSQSPERQARTYLIYNPKKEPLEEFKKRYDQVHAERREKLRKYQREYKKRSRKKNKEAENSEQK
jgi:hypothetical protein